MSWNIRDDAYWWMVLNALPDVGSVTARRLIERFGHVKRIFTETYDSLRAVGGVTKNAAEKIANWRQFFDIEQEVEKMHQLHAQFITQDNKLYPSHLKYIYDPPIGLYVRGKCNLAAKNMVAIIGTRKASTYGLRVAREFAQELARMNYIVVSGMAVGIDTAAHEGAMAGGDGCTIAVLGTGVDVIYPRENKYLYHRLIDHGSVVSEFAMGRMADKLTFPIRNRIIAGMSKCVIVAESGVSGGSNITANIANEYGRTVLAVPGRIDQPSSQGCNLLIRDGATLVSCIDHVLEELNISRQLTLDVSPSQQISLDDPVERKIVDLLKLHGPMDAEEMINHVDIPSYTLLPKLQMMELKKYISKGINNQFELII